MSFDRIDPNKLPLDEVVDRIVKLTNELSLFWSNAIDWAPVTASEIFSTSRMDWQASLSETLRIWTSISPLTDGHLILGWTNLGALVEGTMKLFLSVFYDDYVADHESFRRKGKFVKPDTLALQKLKEYFKKRELLSAESLSYLELVQFRRNAIHAYKNRDIGTATEIASAIRSYLLFLRELHSDMPYPDESEFMRPCEV